MKATFEHDGITYDFQLAPGQSASDGIDVLTKFFGHLKKMRGQTPLEGMIAESKRHLVLCLQALERGDEHAGKHRAAIGVLERQIYSLEADLAEHEAVKARLDKIFGVNR